MKSNKVKVCVLTGVEDSGEHPALGEADWDAGVGVLQQDLNAAGPGCWRSAHGVIITPVTNQHTIIILGVQLRGKERSKVKKHLT